MDITLFDNISTDLTEFQNELTDEVGKLSESITTGEAVKIRLKKNKFIFPPYEDDSVINDTIDVVIVGFKSTNQYFGNKKYNPDNPQPPVCYAVGDKPNELSPVDNSPEKQAELCANCKQNEWESAAVGKGKACKNSRYLAVMKPGDPNGEIFTISVAPTGIKAFDSYINKLLNNKYHPVMIVTQLGFDQKPDYPKLTFTAVGVNEQAKEFFANKEEADKLLTQIPNFERT